MGQPKYDVFKILNFASKRFVLMGEKYIRQCDDINTVFLEDAKEDSVKFQLYKDFRIH